ncbi:hypothetical protein SVAN01_05514 [Stagonosporopsis vannaccii]|nr:hypothetical protein SVAN01_05514 [Stagonosporopsis vannaccii]
MIPGRPRRLDAQCNVKLAGNTTANCKQDGYANSRQWGVDGVQCDLEGVLGLKDDGINCLKRNTTAVAGMLAHKERIDATTRWLALGSVLSVAFGRPCSERLHAISYLISPSPSVSPGHLRSLCEIRGDNSRPQHIRLRPPPQTAPPTRSGV